MQLTLEGDEAQTLRDVLTQYLTELRGEIGKTDDRDLRRALHERERVLQKIVDQLRS